MFKYKYTVILLLLLAVLPGMAGLSRAVMEDSESPMPADSAISDSPVFLTQDGDSLLSHGTDSLILLQPELPDSDTLKRYKSRIVRTRTDLDNSVKFSASDSMVLLRRDSAYLFGSGNVEYGEIDLRANIISMNLHNSTVDAQGTYDSLGTPLGTPVFKEGQDEYEARTMSYNFRTQKGYITNVITQQGEGYLTGGITKKDSTDAFYIKDGRYTTCDNHDCPHFYFNITRGKMRAGKDVVTGPVYMVLAGLPLPLALPFGYFPFSENYSSGVIFPSFGDDYQRGFYLSNGGYYLALSDYADLALTGEIYTKGSWGIQARSSYAKRYKFSGNFNISFLKTIYGEKGDPDYSAMTNFQVLWSHNQDSKANPNLNFSASVNFATSGYLRNDVASYYSNAFTENTKSSTVNMTYRFPGTKWSVSATMNISQRTQDSTLAVSFPNFTVNLSQVAPFKRKHAAGAEKWYEKIRLSYNGQFQNSLTAKQDQFFKKSLIKDWRNGMRHNIPISATFNAFNYLNITPSVNITDRMYTQKVRRQWDPNAAAEVADTTYSLYNVYDFNASLSLDTKVYGFWQPLGFLGKKIKMIRHVMTPSVSLSGAPDFGSKFFGYYDTYTYIDPQGNPQEVTYSMFPNALYGVPSRGKQGVVSFNLANNLEMKVRQDNDSVPDAEKKISLIENLSISESYNFAADSLNWSNINTNLLLRLTKNFNLNLNAVWDTYTYQLNQNGNPVRVNIPRWKAGKGLGRLSSTGTSFSYTFNNDTFRKKNKRTTSPETSADPNSQDSNPNSPSDSDGDDAIILDDGYEKWKCPWSLTLNYSISYGYGAFNKQKMEYDGKINQNLSFSGNISPTPNWNFSFMASYNFDTKKLAYMNCNISRDLHCFVMSASFVPVGPYKSYNFHIAVKSSMLSDLKYDKRSSLSNGMQWY